MAPVSLPGKAFERSTSGGVRQDRHQPLVDRHDAQQAEGGVAERLHGGEEQPEGGVEGDELVRSSAAAGLAPPSPAAEITTKKSAIDDRIGKNAANGGADRFWI